MLPCNAAGRSNSGRPGKTNGRYPVSHERAFWRVEQAAGFPPAPRHAPLIDGPRAAVRARLDASRLAWRAQSGSLRTSRGHDVPPHQQAIGSNDVWRGVMKYHQTHQDQSPTVNKGKGFWLVLHFRFGVARCLTYVD